jgi:hypothetical protein
VGILRIGGSERGILQLGETRFRNPKRVVVNQKAESRIGREHFAKLIGPFAAQPMANATGTVSGPHDVVRERSSSTRRERELMVENFQVKHDDLPKTLR